MQQKIFFFIVASFIAILFSCEKKDEKAGLEIQPDENRLQIAFIGLDDFVSYSAKSDPVKTNKDKSSVLVGSIYDDTFGRSTANFLSQYRLSSDNVNFGDNPEIISVTAFFSVYGIEGDSSQTIPFKVYELKIDIDPDSSYLSNIILEESVDFGEIICDYNFTADTFNTIELPFNTDFGQQILDAYPDTLKNNDNFLEVFKGIYFTVDTTLLATGDGAIWKLNLNSTASYINLKYTNISAATGNRDTIDFKLQFNDKVGRFNQYINNNTPLNNIFSKDTNKVYVSGIGGTRGHINLSEVLKWKVDSIDPYTETPGNELMIYKAELIIKSKPSSIFNVPYRLLLEVDDNDDELDFVDDYKSGATNYHGYYDSKTESYSMIITRHIQNLLNKNHNNENLWIIPDAQLVNPYRVILENGENGNNFMIKISYSKLY